MKSDPVITIRIQYKTCVFNHDFVCRKTDLWSFGVLMWEVVTLGSTPYPGMSGSEVMKRVKEGHRLEKPEHCDRKLLFIF